jgi:hypothetical protein
MYLDYDESDDYEGSINGDEIDHLDDNCYLTRSNKKYNNKDNYDEINSYSHGYRSLETYHTEH